MTVVQSEVHTQFGPVDRKKEIQGGMVGEKSDGAEVLVADVMRTSDPRRPALEVLPNIPNLSLNVCV